MGYGLALASAFFFAASNVFFSKGLRQSAGTITKPLALFITIIINNIINAFVILVSYALDQFSWPELNRMALLCFIGGGIFTTFLGRYLSFSSIEKIGATRYGPLKITTPLFTVIIGVIFLRETITPPGYLGIAAVLAGVYLISKRAGGQLQVSLPSAEAEADSDYSGKQAGQNAPPNGVMLGVLSGAIYSAGYVLRKLGVSYYPVPVVGVAVGSLTALLINWLILAVQKKVTQVLPALKISLKTFFPGGLCTSLGLFSFFYALQLTPVSLTNAITASEPFFIFLLTYFFKHHEESLSPAVVLSTCLIIGGVSIIYFSAS